MIGISPNNTTHIRHDTVGILGGVVSINVAAQHRRVGKPIPL
jgi:hypothetical protein